MSQRSIRRAHERRLAKEQRRDALRLRRAGLAAGAAIGVAAFGAAPAGAATFTVTTTADSGPGSLRQAVDDANLAMATPDTIVFDPAVSGTITLASEIMIDPASISDPLTITGPGRDVLAISGANTNRIFHISNDSGEVSISGLTLRNGFADAAGTGGGAIVSDTGPKLSLTDVTVKDSLSDSAQGGGGIRQTASSNAGLVLTRSTISGNTASAGNGGGLRAANKYGAGILELTDSVISGNSAVNGGGIYGGGRLAVEDSTLTGNTATGSGGAMQFNTKYAGDISGSVISGNTAAVGGGMALSVLSYVYTTMDISETTISGNHGARGAGLALDTVTRGGHVTIDRSTISGNDGGASSFGGGILMERYLFGQVEVTNSTISGNTATSGAGVSIGSDSGAPVQSKYNGDTRATVGSLDFANSTIAANVATGHGGGIYLSQYDSVDTPPVQKSATVSLTSTVVADNGAEDLDRVDTSTSGGFDGAFALVEHPGDAPLTKVSTIVGTDPALGSLANNGGPTRTQVPSGTSALLDQGQSPRGLKVDQRGQPRPVQTDLTDPADGDGTDIGAVELAKSAVVIPPAPPGPPPAPKQALSVTLRGTALGALGPPLLIAGSTPVSCAVAFGTIGSCVMEVRAGAPVKTRAATVAAGALLATGEVIASSSTSFLSTGVRLTRSGKALLRRSPLGIDAAATVHAAGQDPLLATGTVHLLHSPRITVPTGTRSRELPAVVLEKLGRVARLIAGARTVSCTAFSDRGRRDVALTRAQARAACAALTKAGLTARTTSAGAGHALPVATNRTPAGRAANRRIRISFRF